MDSRITIIISWNLELMGKHFTGIRMLLVAILDTHIRIRNQHKGNKLGKAQNLKDRLMELSFLVGLVKWTVLWVEILHGYTSYSMEQNFKLAMETQQH